MDPIERHDAGPTERDDKMNTDYRKYQLPVQFDELCVAGILLMAADDERISFDIDADAGTVSIVWNGNDE